MGQFQRDASASRMKILVIGKFYTEGFALHIAETLDAMGHGVRRFEPGLRAKPSRGNFGRRLAQVSGTLYSSSDSLPFVRARRIRDLWSVVEQQPLDLVIVCHDFLWPGEVAELKRRTGAKVAMWFPDHLANFGRAYFMTAPYDALFFKDPYIVYSMKDVLRSPVYYLPECFNPLRHWLPEGEIGSDSRYKCDVTTAGNQHSWRVAFFSHLKEYDVKLWGNNSPLWMPSGELGGMYQGNGVYNEEKVRAFRGAKIVLNNLHFGEVWGVNVRTFEAAGAGAFQLVNHRPGISQLFSEPNELVTFRDISDLKRKLDYWLPRDAERQIIASAARIRAHRDHTYAKRLDLMLNTMNSAEGGFPLPGFIEAGWSL